MLTDKVSHGTAGNGVEGVGNIQDNEFLEGVKKSINAKDNGLYSTCTPNTKLVWEEV